MARTRGRRPGGLDTRSAIIAVARREFGERGYGATTLRSVAAGAQVDPRLVLHYFGSKHGLFEAAVELPVQPEEAVAAIIQPSGDGRDLGTRVAEFVLSTLEDPTRRLVFIGLLRAAVTDPETARLIREILAERMLLPIARGVTADRPQLRAALAASQAVGLAVTRYVVAIGPLASATHDELVRALAPVFSNYLEGPWTEASEPPTGPADSPARRASQ
jgi:AcrR family transcriptional regulator